MAQFETKVVRVDGIEPIEGADRIELAVIGGYRSIVKRGAVHPGDPVAYISEQSVVPSNVTDILGLTGKLSGSNRDRVKAVKFLGVLSQGIVFPLAETCTGVITLTINGVSTNVTVGQDVSQILGITKYEPHIPSHLSGVVYNAGTSNTVKYDLENLKKFPSAILPNEEVSITEKIHGSCCGVGVLPEADTNPETFGQYVVFSKGQGEKGLCFKNVPDNNNAAYVKATVLNPEVKASIDHVITALRELNHVTPLCKVFIFGEVYGSGVQDLTYGSPLTFRAFDIAVKQSDGRVSYIDASIKRRLFTQAGLLAVPELYVGPYSLEIVQQLTSGSETVSGLNTHLREGVVITPISERYDSTLGRVILKSVSDDYLLRKNGSEYQ